MYKKCGERGTTIGGDHGKETVEIAVPFFVSAFFLISFRYYVRCIVIRCLMVSPIKLIQFVFTSEFHEY